MKRKTTKCFALAIAAALLISGVASAPAQDSELEKLKATMQQMQKTMAEMQKKIEELEKQKAAPATVSSLEKASPSMQTLEKIASGEQVGHASQVTPRPALNDQ